MSVPRICRRFLWLPLLPAVLLASCAGLQIQFPEDPVAVLLAGGAEKPAALAVFPPDFMVSLFAGDVFAQAAEESPQAAQMLDFLSDLFSRSDAVFAAFFSGGEVGADSIILCIFAKVKKKFGIDLWRKRQQRNKISRFPRGSRP